MNQSEDMMRKLIEQIALTRERELDCGEVFAVLDEYAEAMVAGNGNDIQEQFALVIHHLELCPDCLEEYEALLTVLQTKH